MYGQPLNPVVPQRRLLLSSLVTILVVLGIGVTALVNFRERLNEKPEEERHDA